MTTTNSGYSTMHSYPFITDGPKEDNKEDIPVETPTIETNNKQVPPGMIHIKPTWKPVKLDEKPPFSYATIIAHAILSSEERKLTLSEIYQWISDKYPCYSMKDNRWQNSIRHNLSLQKAFVKLERDVSTTTISSGKGCYWTILPGYEQQFINNLLKRGLATTSIKSKNKLTAAASHKQFKKFIDHSSKRKSSHLFTIFRMNPTTTHETSALNKKKRKVTKKSSVKKVEQPPVEYDSDCDSGIDLNCEMASKKQVPTFSPIPDYTSLMLDNMPLLDEARSFNFYDDSNLMNMIAPPTPNDAAFGWPPMQEEQAIDLSTTLGYGNTFYNDFYNYVDPTSFLHPSFVPSPPLLYNGDFCL